MPQTSYTINTNAFIAGNIGFANGTPTIFTYANTLQTLNAGYGVVLGAGPGLCKLPTGSSDKFIGAVVRDLNFSASGLPTDPNTDPLVVTSYPIDSAIGVMARGQLQVYTNQDVTAGNDVYIVYKTNVNVQTIVFSGDLITANSVAGTVNGTALTATVFDTTNAQTLTNLAAKIAAIDGITSAASDGTHTITVTADLDTTATLTGFVVTLGVSQATVAITTTQVEVPTTDIGKFRADNGNSAFGTTVAEVIAGCRWLEASGLDINGDKVAMLDININAN